MAKSTSVTVVYMTPSLEGLEGVDPADEFEDLDDLARRAQLDDIEALLNRAVIYYTHFLDARESGRVMIAQPYDSKNGFALYDEEAENYHQADIRELNIESEVLESIRDRAGLDTIDELLKRSLILFEFVVQAREAGWGIALYDQKNSRHLWITDDLQSTTSPSAHGPGKPTYQ